MSRFLAYLVSGLVALIMSISALTVTEKFHVDNCSTNTITVNNWLLGISIIGFTLCGMNGFFLLFPYSPFATFFFSLILFVGVFWNGVGVHYLSDDWCYQGEEILFWFSFVGFVVTTLLIGVNFCLLATWREE